MVVDNEKANNILKLSDSLIIHPETHSFLVMLPIPRSTKLKCGKKRRRLSSSINHLLIGDNIFDMLLYLFHPLPKNSFNGVY